MDARLYDVIRDFERATAAALQSFLSRAQLNHPFDWRAAGIAQAGELPGEPRIHYEFHGAGIRLEIGSDAIDFDFGFDGRTGGFNEWWLREFADARPSSFPELLIEPDRLSHAFSNAVAAGEIEQPFLRHQDSLWYLRRPGSTTPPTT